MSAGSCRWSRRAWRASRTERCRRQLEGRHVEGRLDAGDVTLDVCHVYLPLLLTWPAAAYQSRLPERGDLICASSRSRSAVTASNAPSARSARDRSAANLSACSAATTVAASSA